MNKRISESESESESDVVSTSMQGNNQLKHAVIGMGKPWYGPFSIFTNKIEISMGHSL